MGATRLQLEIYSHAYTFRERFRLMRGTEYYLYFESSYKYQMRTVAIYKTSAKCFRVMYFYGNASIEFFSEYTSFRSIAALCVYLEKISKF